MAKKKAKKAAPKEAAASGQVEDYRAKRKNNPPAKLPKALGGVIDPDRFEALSDTVSLPFPPGKHRCVAVKVIDPRGNEVMRVHRLG